MLKNWLAFLTLIVAVASLPITVAQSAVSSSPFSDVAHDHWAASAIAEAVRNGYVSGYPDDTFKPDQEVTREEFLKMLIDALGYELPSVPSGLVWSFPYIKLATYEELIDEFAYRYPDGHQAGERPHGAASVEKNGVLLYFSVSAANYPITRLEMIDIVLRALGKKPLNEYRAMIAATELGLLHGTSDGKLNSHGTTTRAQAVAIIDRVLRLQQGIVLPVDPTAVARAKGDGQYRWLSVDSGPSWGMGLREDGSVWIWGSQSYYDILGLKNTNYIAAPTHFASLGQVKQISAGRTYGLALKEDGSVWIWGRKSTRSGELEKMPIQDVITIAAGMNHALFLKKDGTVWAWGNNTSGELGDNQTDDLFRLGFDTNTTVTAPIQVSGLKQIIGISAGGKHSVALDADGTVWAWGNNEKGQVGPFRTNDQLVTTPRKIESLSNVISVQAGDHNTYALTMEGTVWAWGGNNFGELGTETPTLEGSHLRQTDRPIRIPDLDDVIAISAENSFSALALKRDGTVWAWGTNYNNMNVMISNYGRLSRRGEDPFTPIQIKELENIQSIHAGGEFFAIDQYGNTWAWGDKRNLGIEFSQKPEYTYKPYLLERAMK